MTKKILLAMSAITMLFATSCEKTLSPDVAVGETSTVSFNIGTPEMVTRAYSDGATATVLQYAVYDETGAELTDLRKTDAEIHGSTTVEFQLTTGNTYSVIFWAAAPNAPYSVDFTNKKMTVNYTNAVSNDESRDAFYVYHTFTVSGTQTEKVELKRPFAQLNIGTNDYAASKSAGYEPKYSFVKVPVSSELNLVDGAVNAAAEVEFKLAAIPTGETFPVQGYEYMAMNYLLVGAEKEVVDVTFGYSENSNGAQKTRTVGSVPVQRNYRTNIYGQLLTSDVDVNVEINPDYNEPSHVADALYLAAAVGGEYTLTEDVILPETLNVQSNMVLNLNGKTITGPSEARDSDGNRIHVIVNNAELTIIGGTIKSVAENGGSAIYNYGSLELNNTTIEGAPSNTTNGYASYAINSEGASSKLIVNNSNISGRGTIGATDGTKVEINGGNYYTPEVAWGHAIYAIDEGTEVVINDGVFSEGYAYDASNWGMYQIYSGEKAKVVVKGGDFSETWDCANGFDLCTASDGVIEIYGGKFAENPSSQNGKNYVADGCYAIEYETDIYTVQAFDAANRTFIINSREEFLNLNALNDKWAQFFSNGQGTEYSNYATQNGGKGTDFYYKWGWTIKLNVDIDLSDVTSLVPINLEGFGIFDGNGHTIKNATVTTNSDAGLFRAGHAAIKNLNLDNVKVKGGNDASVGILTSDCHAFVDNVTISNSSSEGGKYAGGVVGYGYCDVTNCTLTNCSVKGCYKFGGVIGYICASGNNEGNVENNTLVNCAVEWTGSYSTGKTEVVMGKVVGNFNCNGTCEGNTISNMTTEAVSDIGKIEAGKNVKVLNTLVVTVSTAADLYKLATATGDVKIALATDITLGNDTDVCNAVNFANATSVTIDGGNKTITFKGKAGNKSDTSIERVAGILSVGDITIKNVTLVNDKLSYFGTETSADRIQVYTTIRGASVAYEKVTFNGGVQVKGNESFIDCEFTESVLTTNAEGYATDGRFCMFIDHEYDTTGEWAVKLENCTFNASGYGCVKVAGDKGAKITVDVKGCSFTNTCPSNSWSQTTPKYDVKATGANVTVKDLGGNTWANGLAQ